MREAGELTVGVDFGPLCSFRGCMEDVFALDPATGDGWCAGDLEVMIDRWEALAIAPSLRFLLPAPDDR
jgi:hypothetical protein